MENLTLEKSHNKSNVEGNDHPVSMKRYFFMWIALFLVGFGVYKIGYMQGKEHAWGGSFPSFPLTETAIVNSGYETRDLDFSLFWRAWDLLEKKYVDADELDARTMMYGAIEGMLQSSGDPYTIFFDPEENKEFNEDISGEFEGIGAELEMRDGLITVVAPLKGTPADQAGIRSGDIIIEVDGEDVTDDTLFGAVSKMRGPKGTEVTLTILREGASDTFPIVIVRDTIQVNSVEWEIRDDVGIVHITQFGKKTLDEFQSALQQIQMQNVRAIALDLRNDPGGYLDVAVDIAGFFLDPGLTVVIQENSEGEQTTLMSRSMMYDYRNTPMVVLINKGSASASEILAGALKYHREEITVVGETSFGKGSVQELLPLPQNTSAKITVAKWLTPGGDHIDKKGIEPEVVVEMTEEDYKNDRDPQLDKALEILRGDVVGE